MAANKVQGEIQKAELLHLIAQLDRRGWSQFQVRDEVKRQMGLELSQPMIGIYLRQIREQYAKATKAEREAQVREKLEQLRDVRREAWVAYERSMEDTHKVVEEFATDREYVGIGDFITSESMVKRIVTKEGRLPDNAYLATIMKTLDAERALLGLDQAKADVVTLDEVMRVLGMIKDAIKEVLAEHPDLLRVLMTRAQQVVPVTYKVVEKQEVAS